MEDTASDTGQPWVDGRRVPFHRVPVGPSGITVEAGDRPATVWVPSGATVRITSNREVVVDVGVGIDHEDSVRAGERERASQSRITRLRIRLAQSRRLRRGLDRNGRTW